MKISVVIPSYNHEKFIKCAIESILDQSFKPHEIIIVDDGSTDNTYNISIEFARKFNIIKLFRHKNTGAHYTINKSISIATGDIICILNSDDIFNSNKISRVKEIYENDDMLNLIFGKFQFINEDGILNQDWVFRDWIERSMLFYNKTGNLPLSLLNENFAATTSNFVFKKTLWEKIGGFKNLRYSHDLDFLMDTFRYGKIFFDNSFEYIKYRVHPSNTIKENILNVRLEVASILATNLSENTENIFFYDKTIYQNLTELNNLLNNKNLSKQVLILSSLYKYFRYSKLLYYDYIYENKVNLIKELFSDE